MTVSVAVQAMQQEQSCHRRLCRTNNAGGLYTREQSIITFDNIKYGFDDIVFTKGGFAPSDLPPLNARVPSSLQRGNYCVGYRVCPGHTAFRELRRNIWYSFFTQGTLCRAGYMISSFFTAEYRASCSAIWPVPVESPFSGICTIAP